MSTIDRCLPTGVGRGAAETSGTVVGTRLDGFTREQWEVVQLAWLSGLETGDAAGYVRGRNESHTEVLAEWVSATFSPDYEPRAGFVGTGEPKQLRFGDRKPQTAEQILAAARWSWRQVELKIQRRTA